MGTFVLGTSVREPLYDRASHLTPSISYCQDQVGLISQCRNLYHGSWKDRERQEICKHTGLDAKKTIVDVQEKNLNNST